MISDVLDGRLWCVKVLECLPKEGSNVRSRNAKSPLASALSMP